MELAKRIESLFKKRCAEYKKSYRLNFGVYYTPAENLCYTAMKKFKTKYGDIENVTYINIPQTDADGNVHMVQHDKPYFTNSIHVPVYKKLDAFQKIDIESQLTGYSNAGCITYVELDASIKNNIDALEEILDYALDKDCPYVAFNVPIDYCENCGHSDDIPGDTCPLCGSSHISRLRRVTGYLTGDYKTAFNYGKQMETDDRVKHTGIKIV
jgi:ribonucleoside-triphosphate reductase